MLAFKRKYKLRGNNIPFVQAHHIGGKQSPTAVLLRTSFTTGDKGAALAIANTWLNPHTKTESCHYVIDEARVYRCVPDKIEAKPLRQYYKDMISINLCYDPPEGPVDAVTSRAAHLVARLCKLYKIRPQILSYEEEARWSHRKWRSRGGIILKTVGDFPIDEFFDSVCNEIAAIR